MDPRRTNGEGNKRPGSAGQRSGNWFDDAWSMTGTAQEPARRFPRSPLNPFTGSTSSYAPATSLPLRGRTPSQQPPSRRHDPTPKVAAHQRWPGTGCYEARFCQVRAAGSLEGFSGVGITYAFPSRYPDPRHLTVLARPVVVRVSYRPRPRSRDQTALSFIPVAATTERRCPSSPHSSKAHRGALPT